MRSYSLYSPIIYLSPTTPTSNEVRRVARLEKSLTRRAALLVNHLMYYCLGTARKGCTFVLTNFHYLPTHVPLRES